MITRVEVHKAKAEAKKNNNPNIWLWIIFICLFGLVMYLATRLVNKYL